MLRARALIFVIGTLAMGGAGVAACSGNDILEGPTADSGTDGASGDGFTTDGPTGDGPDGRTDGGPCDFNQFVTGLIQNHTNDKDLPSVDLGENCVDTQTPFPSTLFQ